MMYTRVGAAILLALASHGVLANADVNNFLDLNTSSLTPVTEVPVQVGDGWFMGVQGGMVAAQKLYTSSNGQYPDSMNNYLAGGRIGYGAEVGTQGYLGAQVEANWQNPHQHDEIDSDPTTFRLLGLYGFSLLPGYHISPNSLLYLKGGVASSRLMVASSNPANDQDADINLWQAGLGYEAALNTHWMLGLEYDYLRNLNNVNINANQYTFSEQVYLLTLSYQLDALNQTIPASSTAALQINHPYVGARMNYVTTQLNYGDGQANLSREGQGFGGDIKLGYGHTVGSWLYLGVEGTAGLSSANTIVQGGTLLQEHGGYGISFMPGVLLSLDNLFYARIGAAWTKLQGTYTEPALQSAGYTRTQLGSVWGLGDEFALTQHLSMNLEYDYTQYHAYDYSVVNSVGEIVDNQYTLSSNAMSLGLNYRF